MQILDINEPGTSGTQKTKDIVVGIDFGTTNSLIAYSKNHHPEVITVTDNHDSLLPSVIFYDEQNSIFVIGKNRGKKNALSSIKRLLAKSTDEILGNEVLRNILGSSGFSITKTSALVPKIDINGLKYSFPELAAKIFIHLKERAEFALKTPVTKAVVSVPAYFDDASRGAVLLAAKIAGFEVLRLIAEPTAAAYAYGLHTTKSGTYMVYDLGGGTFDVSILKMKEGVLQVVATGGDNLLGGDDIDHVLAKYLAEKLKTKLTPDLYQEAKRIKEALSKEDEGTLSILSNSDMELLAVPLIDKTIKIAKDTLFDARVELDGIILVGGSTKMKMISRKLADTFGTKILSSLDPDKAVVLGAALQAENLSPQENDSESKSLLIDVLSLSIGLELYGGLAEKIILRNTPIPFSVTKSFTTYVDNQTGMQFHIIQGEREMVKDCRSLAYFELKNIPPMKAGRAKIEVTFAIDADGILSVTALENTSGILQNIEIKPSYGLSREEVDDILDKAFKNAELDHNIKLFASTKLDAEKLITNLNRAIDETPNILNFEEKEAIESAIKELKKLISSDNAVDLREEILVRMQQLNKLAANFIEKHLNFGAELTIKGKHVDEL